MGLHRTLNGPDHLMERREMNDGLHPLHDLLAKRAIPHVSFDQLHVAVNGLEILPLSREEVIQYLDVLSSLHQSLDHVRADKTCSTRYQVLLHRIPLSSFNPSAFGMRTLTAR